MALSLTLQEVSGKTTMTRAQIKATATNWNAGKTVYIRWTYSPNGQFNNRVTRVDEFRRNTNLPTVSQTFDFDGLKPDTGYIIQADVVASRTSTDIMASASTTFATLPIGGTFNYSSRSSSVITMALTGLNPMTFNAEVRLRWKKSTDADTDRLWKEVDRQTISVGEVKDLTHMFTGLTQATSYDFKCEIYDTDTNRLVATYTKTASTLIYSGIIGEVTPSIKEVIIVPLANKGYVIGDVSGELPSGCSIHLLRSSNDSNYTDLGALDGDMKIGITGESDTYVYYKLVVVDGNGNRYNETEPRYTNYPLYRWRAENAGWAFSKTAVEMRRFANALLSLYKYLAVEGDVSAHTEYYEALTAKMGTLVEGSPVEGREGSGFWLINALANSIRGRDIPEAKEKGEPIYASDFNGAGNRVSDALLSIND